MAGTIVFDSAQPDGHSFRVLSNTGTTLLTANTNAIVCTTAGTERMRIDASGRVGIGITNPTSNLHVVGANISSAIMSNMASSVISSGTANTSLSGTAIDFTGIPSWVKRVTVMLNGVSTSGSNILLCQLGTSSGVVISGYVGSGGVTGISNTAGTRTDGIPLEGTGSASFAISGSLILTLLSSNTWVGSGTYGTSGSNYCFFGGGSIALGGTLDRVRITSGGSTDTFDAGSINILYE